MYTEQGFKIINKLSSTADKLPSCRRLQHMDSSFVDFCCILYLLYKARHQGFFCEMPVCCSGDFQWNPIMCKTTTPLTYCAEKTLEKRGLQQNTKPEFNKLFRLRHCKAINLPGKMPAKIPFYVYPFASMQFFCPEVLLCISVREGHLTILLH